MATLVLSAVGAAAGNALGGSVLGLSTAVIGRALGATLGRVIDQRLLGGGSQVVETGRIDRFRITGAGEGGRVDNIYGRMRTGGQVIWATNFREHVDTEEAGGKGGGMLGGGGGATTRSYSYSISLAIALCEGEILTVGRIWADGEEIGRDELDMRVYKGAEDQLPDPKIEAVEGAGNAPAYRGLAYVVLEDVELGRFGNRVPQFSFEVIRPTSAEFVPDHARSLSQIIRGVALVPGTGEYALATTPVHYSTGLGWNRSANVNSSSGKTDFRTSLEQLSNELPVCQTVSLIVSWFGDDLRCDRCQIKPKVEQNGVDGASMPWRAGGAVRDDAGEIAKVDGRPVYGGTPTDQSVVEAIRALRNAGKAVTFYPFLLMEQAQGNSLVDPWSGAVGQPPFPWRGRITTSLAPGVAGSADGTLAARAEVRAFFGDAMVDDFPVAGDEVGYSGPAEWSFRKFILHYAHLCAVAGGVDAFCIGSEMRSLTQIRAEANSFPAVEELRQLAAEVRAVLGPEAKIGYAADWSEYFGYHPEDGSGDVFFHLDPLWADPAIDFVGIDNYMPLSDWRDGGDHADASYGSIYDVAYLKSNVAGGEGFDWYYADEAGRDAQDRLPITDGAHGEPWIYRYKDLRSWWSNAHHDRVDGVRGAAPTAWIPESKPIWFTEMGCAAVDKGTNQPNKFIDPKSSESSLPYYSDGTRDDFVQAQYLRAMYSFWGDPVNNPASGIYGGAMVDLSRSLVWAWDTRPFPHFPLNSELWSDGENYFKGHWLNGRTSSESLAAVVAETCGRAGLPEVDVRRLYGSVRGYTLAEASHARAAIQPLMLAHGFDASERNGVLHFRSRTGLTDFTINADALAVTEEVGPDVETQRVPEVEIAGRVRLNCLRAGRDFEVMSVEAAFPDETNPAVSSSELAMCLTTEEARAIAERWLTESRVARDSVRLALPGSLRKVRAGDVIETTSPNREGRYRIDRVESGDVQIVEAVRVEEAVFRLGEAVPDEIRAKPVQSPVPVYSVFLDLPLLTGKEDPIAPHVAITANPWPGSVAIYSSSENDGYRLNSLIGKRAVIGLTETVLEPISPGIFDRGAPLRVRFSSGATSPCSEERMLNGANAAAIGDPATGIWEVFQFAEATPLGGSTFELGHRLRGQLGTDAETPMAWPVGSHVVLLDGAPEQIDLAASARGLERHYLFGPQNRPFDDASYLHEIHAFAGVGLRPYAPVHLRVRDVGGDLQFTWIRRTRIDGDSWESLDVALGESVEQYLVQVLVAGVVVREEFVGSPVWTYDAARRSADGAAGAFSVRVAQVSDRFGPGQFRRIDIHE
ncbi:glycoside hydrolase/phage tail family protein [Tropicimonas sp. IMCC34043]|uniref:baseplate multidomain protein megatron n=1 Tax=Tropicimonas sp. IMCC34043 TaxID=2248760 RepID=UPI000E22F56D|nr:glycoside hydrolase/phage tail family protein [Tropicimonas sp. IMCC34043]